MENTFRFFLIKGNGIVHRKAQIRAPNLSKSRRSQAELLVLAGAGIYGR